MRGPAALALAFVLGATTPASPADPPAAFQPLLLITEPATLATLEAGGLHAGALAFGRPAARSLAELGATPGWASIAGVLRADIAELYASDSKYGVGMRRTHRGFDPAWLTSPPSSSRACRSNRWRLTCRPRAGRRPFGPTSVATPTICSACFTLGKTAG